ncbi:MAG: hypothetical protein WCS70_01075 [Verrucomicrobiota bacterium]
MFFAAAEHCRNYHGAFAAETETARARLAAEYEKLGVIAEQERKELGVTFAPHPVVHLPANWHCPACHTSFPAALVVCGKCGFDLRTGKAYQAETKPPRREWIGNTKVTASPHLGRAKRREDHSLVWVIGGTAVGVLVLLVVLAICKQHLSAEHVPALRSDVQR